MTTAAAASLFTPLESLLLFQSILKYGFDTEAFGQIATSLRNNSFVQCDKSYDAGRLSSESLQQLFLYLLQEELEGEEQTQSNGSSKKRKAPTPALPTINDVYAHAEQLPALVGRLYARYRDHVVAAIREDERHLAQIQGEILLLEQEEAEAVKQAAEKETAEKQAAEKQAAEKQAVAAVALQEKRPVAVAPPAAVPSPPPAGPSVVPHPQLATAPLPAAPVQAKVLPATIAAKAEVAKVTPSEASPPVAPQAAVASALPAAGTAHVQPAPQHPTRTATPESAVVLPLAKAGPPHSHQAIAPAPAVGHVALAPSAASTPQIPATPSGRPAAGLTASPTKPAQAPVTPQKQTPSQPPQRPPHATGHKKPLPAQIHSLLQVTPTSRAGSGLQPIASSAPAPPQPALHATRPPAAQTAAKLSASPEKSAEPQRSVLPAVKPSTISIQRDRHGHGTHTPSGQAALSAAARSASGPIHGRAIPHSNRPLLPDRGQAAGDPATPTPSQSPRPAPLPETPAHMSLGGFIPRGSGTRWKPNEPTPSTPRPDMGGIASPAYEPLSPVIDGAARFGGVESTLRQRQAKKLYPIKAGPKHETPGSRPRGRPPRNPKPAKTPAEAVQPNIKNEASTPRGFEDLGDTTTEEGGGVNESLTASPSGPLSQPLKRKREESIDFASPHRAQMSSHVRRRLLGPAVPPTHVLWMRGFPKISASALDQISSHRNANMFAHRIRDRDAPGYDSIVRHAVDLKMIRMAIMAGNKAATAVAAGLPESEQSSGSSVWLPINEDLVPPRGIVNSSQLECELVHMFANAIMYNPDSHRGVGLAFVEREPGDDDVGATDASGYSARYKVDEDGVVNDTRGMYIEVEKLLSEMRSAEKQRGVPAPPPGARGLGLPVDDAADEAAGEQTEAEAEADAGTIADTDGEEDGPEADATEEEDGGDSHDRHDGPGPKRRRTTRGQ